MKQFTKYALVSFITAIICISTTAYAINVLNANEVKYDNSNGMESEDVQNAIEELYGLSDECKIGSRITFELENITINKEELNVAVGKTEELDITPNNKYYIDSIVCNNPMTIEYNHGREYTSKQTIKITNNNILGDTTCTIKGHTLNYEAILSSVNATSSSKQAVCGQYSYQGGNQNERHCSASYKCTGCGSVKYESWDDYCANGYYNYQNTHYKTVTTYSCSDGKLNGTKCEKYTCPDGGTLNTTTNICEY